MEEKDTDILESEIEAEDTENLELEPEETEEEDTITIPKKKWDEVQAQKKHWQDKAKEKPEAPKPAPKEEKEDIGLSTADLLAITRANIHEDDIDEVIEFAKFKKLSVKEALAHPVMKATLSTNEEYRKTAEATNDGKSKRVTTKISPEKLQQDLSEGRVPEAGSKDAEELFWARRGGRRE